MFANMFAIPTTYVSEYGGKALVLNMAVLKGIMSCVLGHAYFGSLETHMSVSWMRLKFIQKENVNSIEIMYVEILNVSV